MTGSKASADHDSNSPQTRDSGDESEDESEVLEESPCGRWQKRREQVTQRDVPGIDCAFLAMDTEEGVEVVWNEVRVSEKKASKTQLEKIKQVFDNLIQLDHVNIVKFHNYWTDTKTDNRRVVFITEYMSSGSLKQFLKKTKKNNKTLKAWKRWCTQILSALSYLHSCTPPIIHGNLTTDTVFIQHNGLIKIGSVAPDAIYNHVKTYKEEARNMHYIAPEYAGSDPVTTAVDIYSFGICALEMAALEIAGNGDTGHTVTEESIQKTLDTLTDPLQKDFISKCLEKDKEKRPSARELLFHAVLFEVHSLKLMAAHSFVRHANLYNHGDLMTYGTDDVLPEAMTDEAYQSNIEPTKIFAEVVHGNRNEAQQFTVGQIFEMTYGKGQNSPELEKFLEDVRNGVYPLTAFASILHPVEGRTRAVSPELAESVKSETPEPLDMELRKVVGMTCETKKVEDSTDVNITIVLKMDDKMNRQLTGLVTEKDSSVDLANELVHHGFIHSDDRERLCNLIEETLTKHHPHLGAAHPSHHIPSSVLTSA